MKQFRESNYLVDTNGYVYNKRGIKLKTWKHLGRNIKYERITLNINGIRRGFRVHRMVAELYITNPDNKSEVHHIDGNTFNNNVINLMWVTRIENENFKNKAKVLK